MSLPTCPALSPVFSPIICAAHRLEVLADRLIFDAFGISSAGFVILTALATHTTLRPTNLAPLLHSTPSNLSQRLRTLEEKKLIRRVRANTTDRRHTLYRITPLGRSVHAKCNERIRAADFSCAIFTKEELAQNTAFFKKLHAALDTKERAHITA